jgi:hypothetical protein
MIKNYTTLNTDNFSIYPHINFIFKTSRKLKNLQKHFMVWRKFCCLHAGCYRLFHSSYFQKNYAIQLFEKVNSLWRFYSKNLVSGGVEPQNTTQKSISIVFNISSIRHDSSLSKYRKQKQHPPVNTKNGTHPGGYCFCLRYLLSDESWRITVTQKQ